MQIRNTVQTPCLLRRLSYLLILLILLLQGCVPASRLTITPSIPVLPTIQISPTLAKTATPAPTQTLTAIPTRTITKTPTITPTITSTPLPSLTFLPTVPNAREEVRKLYDTNGGCNLPCWWGITPGMTTFEEVRQHFQQFSGEVHLDPDKDRSKVILYYPPASNSVDYNVSSQLFFENNVVQKIVMDYETVMWGGFFPERMIKEFGKPDQVSFGLTHESQGYLAFLYLEEHIFVEYLLTIEEDAGEKNACFAAFGYMGTWAGENTAVNNVVLGEYKLNPLEESTSMDREAFYEMIQQYPTSFCFPYEVKD